MVFQESSLSGSEEWVHTDGGQERGCESSPASDAAAASESVRRDGRKKVRQIIIFALYLLLLHLLHPKNSNVLNISFEIVDTKLKVPLFTLK